MKLLFYRVHRAGGGCKTDQMERKCNAGNAAIERGSYFEEIIFCFGAAAFAAVSKIPQILQHCQVPLVK